MARTRAVKPAVGFNPRSVARVTASALVTSVPQQQSATPVVPYNRNHNAEPRTAKRVPLGFNTRTATRQIEIAR